MAQTERAELVDRVKTIMRRDLKLGPDIPLNESTPFFGGDADIDSLDILLMLTSIEREFAIKIPSEEVGRQIFENVGTLCDYLQNQLAGPKGPAKTPSTSAPVDPLTLLPHRPPFRFITQILRLEPGKSGEAIWDLSGQEAFFQGHFPGRPIVPGVLIAEALAQLCGLAKNNGRSEGRLAQVDIRFEQPVIPPAQIQLTTRVARTLGTLIQYEVQATCNGSTVARGTLMLSLPPAVNSETRLVET